MKYTLLPRLYGHCHLREIDLEILVQGLLGRQSYKFRVLVERPRGEGEGDGRINAGRCYRIVILVFVVFLTTRYISHLENMDRLASAEEHRVFLWAMGMGWQNVSTARNSLWYFARLNEVLPARIMAPAMRKIRVIAMDFMAFPKVLVSRSCLRSHFALSNLSSVSSTYSSGLQKLANSQPGKSGAIQSMNLK